MKNYLSSLIFDYLQSLKCNEKSLIEVLKTKDLKYGDYTTNTPLRLSQMMNKRPMDIANDIKTFLEENHSKEFLKITVTEPGFVNMFLSNELLVDNVMLFTDKKFKPNFEHVKKEKINYEFVSANPTGDLHIGHARNAIVGEISSRVLKYIGHDVYREYYINDGGNQVNELATSVYFYLAPLLKIESSLDKDSVGYHGKEIINFANELFDSGFELNKKTEKENIDLLKEISVDFFLKEIKVILEKIGLDKFDKWTSEKDLLNSGEVKEMVKNLKEKGALYEKDGATWIKTQQYGDAKDRVLIKKDGLYTYMVADIVNHINKIKKGCTKMINLWGKDHHGYEDRIKASLKWLGYREKLEVDYINMVQILNGTEVVKMSKRSGTSLRIKDILEEMDKDVFKFFIVSKAKEQEMEIDINIAKQNDLSNPFYYIQYSNARINQILEKYKNEIGEIKKQTSFKLIGKEIKEQDLLKKIVEFEDVILSMNKNREPSNLINYFKDLSKTFNSYYSKCKVITDDKDLTEERINLILALKNLYEIIFKLIGIKPINKI